MDLLVTRLVRDQDSSSQLWVKIPAELLAQAGIAEGEVSLRAEAGRLILEPVESWTDLLEMEAESLVSQYLWTLKEVEEP